ncbi:MAG: hypothetical protein NT126_12765 [Bacteroidetes bacterium]|nr:hypothetical protein [Bacteroidota bacterium]
MNRKILSVLLVLLMKISISSAQIHLDSANANLHIVGDRFTLQHATVQVINTGITNLTSVVAERSIVSLAPGHRAYFCWGVFCYDTLTNLSPHAQTIVGGAANGSFLGYLNPYNSAGTSVVDYCFYDNTGASDTLCLRITYDITTGIHDPQGNSFSLSAAYPNPSDWMTSVTYNLNSAKDAHL